MAPAEKKSSKLRQPVVTLNVLAIKEYQTTQPILFLNLFSVLIKDTHLSCLIIDISSVFRIIYKDACIQ